MNIGFQTILLNLLNGQRGEERILFDDFPSIQIKLSIDSALSLIQNIKTKVVRLNR